ncbi:cytochrome P450 [Mollisia scopiformis]|uniref:Cytochrome P450 n=1 Tax=Mollisia scopiformis TaxID=149040 RepID=A0A194X4Q3_MOLSC|nr:cytochrome P450 [Mollisia scopiformis]KUJ15044.1 cytochrome P450 [Mollisia scopiformis]
MAYLNELSSLGSLLAISYVLTILAVSYVLGLAIYNLYFHPLASYPGPKLNAISRIPYLWALVNGNQVRQVHDLHQQYGIVVRVCPDELSYISAEAFKDIYAHRQGKLEMQKNKIFYTQQPGGTTLLTTNREDHALQRRSLSHAFSDSYLRQQEVLIQKYIDLLIQRLEQHADDGSKPLNLVSWYNFTTFDIIGDLTFGESFDCLEKSDYHPWVSMIFSNMKASSYLKALKYVPGGTGISSLIVPKRLLETLKSHANIITEKLNQRLALKTERPDFVGNMQRNEKTFSFDNMKANSSLLIIAGSETTATLLSGVTYHLLRNPNKLNKVIDEVRTTFAKPEDITMASAGTLDYMLACLNEALRMYPPAPVGLPRIVPEGGDMIAGKWVSGGTIVSVCHYASYHSATNFRNPECFVPERFCGDEMYADDNRSVFNPFSTGPRNCIGKNLAYAEMRLILSKLLFNFDLELADKERDWLDQKTYSLWEKQELNVKLKKVVR